jgi:hypothetical protein
MKLYGWGVPYLILRVDALIVDLQPGSRNWRFANRWDPPDWQTEMVTPSGETYAEWRREHGFEELAPQETARDTAGLKTQTRTEGLPLFNQVGRE